MSVYAGLSTARKHLLEARWDPGHWTGYVDLGPFRYHCEAHGRIADQLHRTTDETAPCVIRLKPADPLRPNRRELVLEVEEVRCS